MGAGDKRFYQTTGSKSGVKPLLAFESVVGSGPHHAGSPCPPRREADAEMFIVRLRLSGNRRQAGHFMDDHDAWLQRGFDDDVFMLAGTTQRFDFLEAVGEAR